MIVPPTQAIRAGLYPEGLPHSWYSTWDVTFSRSSGGRRREIVRLILEKNIINEFNSSMLSSGDLEDYFFTYLKAKEGDSYAIQKDEARKVHNALGRLNRVRFKHDSKTSEIVFTMLYCNCDRIDENTCDYTYDDIP